MQLVRLQPWSPRTQTKLATFQVAVFLPQNPMRHATCQVEAMIPQNPKKLSPELRLRSPRAQKKLATFQVAAFLPQNPIRHATCQVKAMIPQNPNKARNLPGCSHYPPELNEARDFPGCGHYPTEPTMIPQNPNKARNSLGCSDYSLEPNKARNLPGCSHNPPEKLELSSHGVVSVAALELTPGKKMCILYAWERGRPIVVARREEAVTVPAGNWSEKVQNHEESKRHLEQSFKRRTGFPTQLDSAGLNESGEHNMFQVWAGFKETERVTRL
ncbi:hypothetical protein B0H14DRAFT_2651940 [Mycena olivaceomarginata]|nr:hypothetical protein B0H14DRAFT_2651940 [Mycena olivaceomarginata]